MNWKAIQSAKSPIGGRNKKSITEHSNIYIWLEFGTLGTKPTPNPNNRPIFSNVSSVGFAVPASISATWRLVSASVLANSSCVIPKLLRISPTAPGNRRSPLRARSARLRLFSRIFSLVGFFQRAISHSQSRARRRNAISNFGTPPHGSFQNFRWSAHIFRHTGCVS